MYSGSISQQLFFLNESTLPFEGANTSLPPHSGHVILCYECPAVLETFLMWCEIQTLDHHHGSPFPSAPPNPASQRQWQTTPGSYRRFFQNSLWFIKCHKASAHESTSRSCIPPLHPESSFPRHLRGQALFPLHSDVSFFMSFSLAWLLKLAALLSPNLPPDSFSLSSLY